MELTEKDNGRTIDIVAGELVTVSLNENPTTGYRWEVENMSGLEIVSDLFQSTGNAIGAGGIRLFQFRASSVGRHELLLKNWRKWEDDRSVVNRFEVIIFAK